MKTSITSIAKIAGGLALMAASSVAMASVVDTVHNLGASGAGNHTTSTTEICIFCHTPHGGDQSVSAPIWNRAQSSTSVYTRFSSLGRLTFDSKEAPIGSVSIACLSCHDGTQAMDAVINGPGSGNNSNNVGTVASTMTGIGGFKETNMLSTLAPSDNGTLSGDLIYLGTDLRNDHPISMQYGGGGIGVGTTNGATVDPDFAQATQTTGGFGLAATSQATTSTNNGAGMGTGSVNYISQNGQPRWYVDTGTSGYQGTDFPLYTRTDGPSATAQPYVECATCHDPHSANSTFLRLSGGNTGSQVCLTCHAK